MTATAPPGPLRLATLGRIPDGFLECSARSVHTVLPVPTLIHLPGRRAAPLFVSILLHGNEDVGLHAVQRVLARHHGRELPRALSIFVGNVDAARDGVRRLAGQPDYNRVWPGTAEPASPEQEMMAEVVREMRARGVFAALDLHNNTGRNPHYACVTRLRHPDLQLASLFSRTVVYFRRPLGVQAIAFAELCPAATCECGKTGDASGAAHAAELLDACLHLADLPVHPVRSGDVHLFHTVAIVKVPPATSLSFDGSDAALRFGEDLEWFNFRELPEGTELARCTPGDDALLDVRDEEGRDVAAEFLVIEGDRLRLRRPAMPSMLTRDPLAIRQDCLCYFMERYPLPT